MAPVCTSFSSSLRPAVRSAFHAWSLPPNLMPEYVGNRKGYAYLAEHSTFFSQDFWCFSKQ
eukprot:2290085-Prymnesium_polylepis.1